MHNRLYAGSTHLCSLPSITADVYRLRSPKGASMAVPLALKPTRLGRRTTLYSTNRATRGRLIPADIAGLFVRTQNSGFQYLLVAARGRPLAF
eukprot:1721038-Pleurochrysis_carterae.AAC.1